MIVYLDLIFLLNLLIDAVLLLATAWTRKTRVQFWRICISSLIGACYVLMLFAPSFSFFYTFAIKFICSLFMVWIGLGYRSLQSFAGHLSAFYLVSFAAAGGIYGFHYFMASTSEVTRGILFSRSGGEHIQIGLFFLLLLFGVTILLYKAVFEGSQKKKQLQSFYAHVSFSIEGKLFTCTGLIDTGNQLCDPLTRTPVMIMEASLLGDLIPDTWMHWIREGKVEEMVASIGTEAFDWPDRLRLIPYRAVNHNNRFMLAIKPDRVVVTFEGQTLETSKVFIGLEGGKLCNDHSYHAIIHPQLVNMQVNT